MSESVEPKRSSLSEEAGNRRQMTTVARRGDDRDASLWASYKKTQDPNLRNILIEKYMPLVRSIAERVYHSLPRSVELDDLVSAGTFGLMDAIEGFDLSRGIKFRTYCSTRVRGSIIDDLRSQDWVPRLVRVRANQLQKSMTEFESEFGRSPNAWELAEAMDLTVDELLELEDKARAKMVYSISENCCDDDDDGFSEQAETLADESAPDPVQFGHEKDVLELVTRDLTSKERLVVTLYYYEGKTMSEIADVLDVTESRICQIHGNIMRRLECQLDREQLMVG